MSFHFDFGVGREGVRGHGGPVWVWPEVYIMTLCKSPASSPAPASDKARLIGCRGNRERASGNFFFNSPPSLVFPGGRRRRASSCQAQTGQGVPPIPEWRLWCGPAWPARAFRTRGHLMFLWDARHTKRKAVRLFYYAPLCRPSGSGKSSRARRLPACPPGPLRKQAAWQAVNA